MKIKPNEDEQIEGQMSIFDFQECIPQEETTKQCECNIPQTFSEYVGRCEYCYWGKDEETCHWSINYKDKCGKANLYECDEKHSFWKPNAWKIPRLCGNCRYSNCFHYEVEEPYKALFIEKGYTKEGADHPVEDSKIYCTRREDHEDSGGVNRSRPYESFCNNGFGVGHWHRQREWDTCDAWELDTEWHKELKEQKK